MKPALSACKDIINILTQYTVNDQDIFILKGWESNFLWGDAVAHNNLINHTLPISLEINVARLIPICMLPDLPAHFSREFAMWGPGKVHDNKPNYVVNFGHWVPALGGSTRIETYNVENIKEAKEIINDFRKLPITNKADTFEHKDEIDAFINKWEKRSIELRRKVRMGKDF
jgi:hypothetical protein